MDIRRCYDILDIPLEATEEEIRRQYRDLVNVWHPDRYGSNPRLREKAEKKLGEINAAFDAVMAFVDSRTPDPPAAAEPGAIGGSSEGHHRTGTGGYSPPHESSDPAAGPMQCRLLSSMAPPGMPTTTTTCTTR